ncbi:DUF6314 family protein [Streptomyces spectabilis]|uniref:DUF6314 domain-containing protein n=1 Tax=Streptomyces spectabilis TaxID=68270 RepID=A0A5P2X384_STRST|nr:DUF6314 family protein [Streptomyces spectabilis]MBB5105888.1 hypothetical protein [Streptomyces spectabilis]MCI3901421.1 DUF6314 family protein [Streptomyces spectabilis]QEV58888.1 hypothetical protein CP982_09255 [Streptomyces spectabilis]GGV24728.1 hypothetical protein GCM10010245_40980 [Streptomyces spectabilis]
MSFPVPDALAHLAGEWRVERTVRDFAAGADGPAEGSFSGTTRFTPLPGGGLLHHESGTFTWRGTPRPAERTLRFLPGEPAGTVLVRFADGRFFHGLDLRTGRHTADHPCAADLYRGDFVVDDADSWRTRWRVRGPAKDLLLTTRYARVVTARRAPSTCPGSAGP